jgi:hypothetical protein
MPPVLGALAAGAGVAAASGPLVLASFTTVGAAAAAAGGISIAGALGNLALGLAFSGAAALLSRPSQRSLTAGVNSNEIRLNSRQEVPPVRFIVGEALVGGALFFEECKPPFLYLGVLLSEGPVTALVGLQNSQTPIGIDYETFEVLTPPYTDRLFVSFRNGASNQAIDPILDADFSNLPSTFRQRGICTLVIKADYGADWDEFQEMWGQTQKPNILAKIRGIPVYDPRDPTQSAPPSRAEYSTEADYQTAWETARATWKWTQNATLIQAWYLISRFGGRIDASRIRWDKIAESATWDDGLIGTNDGDLIPRHTIDGVITAGQEPFSVLQSLLTANRGIVVRSAGDVWIQTAPQEPILTINDEMIVGGIEYRRSQPKKRLLNRVRVRFIDPRQDWQTVDGPVIDDTDLQEEDGQLLEESIELPFTADHRRAQRLARCHILDSRLGREIKTLVSLDAIARCKYGEFDPGRVVTVYSNVMPRMNGTYRIMEVGFADGFSALEVSLAEYDPSIDLAWNPETDEQEFELPDLDVS